MESIQFNPCPRCTWNVIRKMTRKLVKFEIIGQDSNTRAVRRQSVVNCQMNDLGGKSRVARRERLL